MTMPAERGIISIGDRVAAGDYRLHSSFPRVQNFSDGSRLVSLVTPATGPGPVNIMMEPSPPSAVALSVTETELQLGDRRYSRTAAVMYNSRPRYGVLSPARLTENLAACKARLLADAPPESIAFLLDPAGAPEPETAFMRNMRGRFREYTDRLFAGETAVVANGLRGLGVGLTPSGDDFLVGVLMALDLREAVDSIQLSTVKGTIVAAALGTNLLSNSALALARDGRLWAAGKELVEALSGGTAAAVREATGKVMAHGATSGCDTVTGLVATMEKGERLWS